MKFFSVQGSIIESVLKNFLIFSQTSTVNRVYFSLYCSKIKHIAYFCSWISKNPYKQETNFSHIVCCGSLRELQPRSFQCPLSCHICMQFSDWGPWISSGKLGAPPQLVNVTVCPDDSQTKVPDILMSVPPNHIPSVHEEPPAG